MGVESINQKCAKIASELAGNRVEIGVPFFTGWKLLSSYTGVEASPDSYMAQWVCLRDDKRFYYINLPSLTAGIVAEGGICGGASGQIPEDYEQAVRDGYEKLQKLMDQGG